MRFFLAGFLAVIWCMGVRYKKTTYGKERIACFLLGNSGLKKLIIYQVVAVFFRSTAQLLQGGMPLAKALAIAAESMSVSQLKRTFLM